MWKVKVIDLNARPKISVVTIASCDTKAKAIKHLVGVKNICRIGRNYLISKS